MAGLKTLGKLPKELTKPEIENLAIQDIDEVIRDGKYDLLKILIELKRYDVYLSKLIETIKSPALEKAKEIGDKKFTYADASVRITKRVVYDYSMDELWSEMNIDLTNIKDLIKEHQNLLKGLDSETTEIVDKGTGELIKVTPPIKKEVDSLTIIL